ncbi:hypothetical protein JCM10213_000480 [Rhodosporidiobolus nylandii]
MSGNDDQSPAPASAPVPRVIPGLSAPPPAPLKKQRKRSSKAKVPQTGGNSEGPQLTGTVGGERAAPVAEEQELASAPVIQEEELVLLEKKTSAVEVVLKRLRASGKKLTRIEGYENQTTPLNPDQQRAVASKPVLEAVIRELNELLAVLKAEDEEDEDRNKRNAIIQEKKQAKAIEAAVQANKADAQSQLVLLFQFLHLHSLFNPSQTSFAPPVLPPVIAAANGQDVAAVRMLFDQFANGPLLGGHNDALDKLAKVAKADEEDLFPGVSFARVQQLIHGLTSPPEDPLPEEHATESNEPARPTDSVIALADGDEGDAHPSTAASAGFTGGVSFLQPSEVDAASPAGVSPTAGGPATQQNGVGEAHHPNPPVDTLPTQPTEEKVHLWAEDVAEEASVPPPSGPVTPAPDTDLGAIGTPSGPSAATPATEVPPTLPPQPAPTAELPQSSTLDWAADDDEGGLPHLPELAPPVPVLNAPVTTAAPNGGPAPTSSGDGFQQQRPRRSGGNGGGEGRGGRGGFRGGQRGSFRGRGRGGFYGQGGQGNQGGEGGDRPPRPERNASGNGEDGSRGGFRGGRGGRGRGGRGRGGGANGQVTAAPVAGPTA